MESDPPPAPAMVSVRTAATAAALAATLGLAAASWVVAARQMNGVDMGVRPSSAPSAPSSPCGVSTAQRPQA
jgi:hypothetical protein